MSFSFPETLLDISSWFNLKILQHHRSKLQKKSYSCLRLKLKCLPKSKFQKEKKQNKENDQNDKKKELLCFSIKFFKYDLFQHFQILFEM